MAALAVVKHSVWLTPAADVAPRRDNVHKIDVLLTVVYNEACLSRCLSMSGEAHFQIPSASKFE